jgi:hypothetical protein
LHDQDNDSYSYGYQSYEHQTQSSIVDIAQILTGYSFLNPLEGKVTNESQVTNDGIVTSSESQVTSSVELLSLYLHTAELRINGIIRDFLLPCHNTNANASISVSELSGSGNNSTTTLYEAIYLLVQALQHVVINVYALFLAPINAVAAPLLSSSSNSGKRFIFHACLSTIDTLLLIFYYYFHYYYFYY